jgi:release factor glutamine methyltransferase
VANPAELAALADRRVAGEPLEHLLGWAEFAGRRVLVGPGVFVPRRRTELLAEQAVARARPGGLVVDLCCGSGAVALTVALALAHRGSATEVHAADIDPAATACARRNLGPVGGHVHTGDLYAALPHRLRGHVDLLVANAPYVPTGELARLPPEARLHESRVALDGGPDGLDVHRRLVAGAADWLAPGGQLLVESGRDQAATTVTLCAAAGLAARVVVDDDRAGTVVVSRALG